MTTISPILYQGHIENPVGEAESFINQGILVNPNTLRAYVPAAIEHWDEARLGSGIGGYKSQVNVGVAFSEMHNRAILAINDAESCRRKCAIGGVAAVAAIPATMVLARLGNVPQPYIYGAEVAGLVVGIACGLTALFQTHVIGQKTKVADRALTRTLIAERNCEAIEKRLDEIAVAGSRLVAAP